MSDMDNALRITCYKYYLWIYSQAYMDDPNVYLKFVDFHYCKEIICEHFRLFQSIQNSE